MVFNITKYILNKIENGDWKINEPIPTESELIEISGLSKMTVRKNIEKLKEREILYSVQGSGIFVSAFNKMTRTNSFEKDNKITRVTFLPTSTELPKKLLDMMDNIEGFSKAKKTSYVKIYFRKDEVIAYAVCWVRNDDGSRTFESIYKNRDILHTTDFFSKLIKISRMEPTTQTDKNILQINDEYIPTTYSYYTQKNREIELIRVLKFRPKHFSSFEIEYNENNFE